MNLRIDRHRSIDRSFVLVAVAVLLLCHGAPDALHQGAHAGASGAHHATSGLGKADHTSGGDVARGYYPGVDNYAAILFTLMLGSMVLGAAMLLTASRTPLWAPRSLMFKLLSRTRQGLRRPPIPTPALLQVFRL